MITWSAGISLLNSAHALEFSKTIFHPEIDHVSGVVVMAAGGDVVVVEESTLVFRTDCFSFSFDPLG